MIQEIGTPTVAGASPLPVVRPYKVYCAAGYPDGPDVSPANSQPVIMRIR